MSGTNTMPDEIKGSPRSSTGRASPKEVDISHVEQSLPPTDDLKKDQTDYSRVDREIAEYAARGEVEIDDATSRRLRRMIDRRVLVVMICTYFLQALDKGTMSFASIMGIVEDTKLVGQQVCLTSWKFSLFGNADQITI